MRGVAKEPTTIFALATVVAAVTYFFGIYPMFGVENAYSALHWLARTWNEENDLQHGYFIPFIMIGLIIWDRKNLAKAPVEKSRLGLWLILGAVFLYLLSKRTVQARVAVGAFPILLTGISAYLWGWQVTRRLVFPYFLIYFAVKVPGMLQATNSLQIFATSTAYHVSSLLGADIVIAGNNIKSATGAWPGFDIAEGCSGIRSLVALTLVAAVYGYVTTRSAWKIAVLIVASIPLAILANGARVTTIILIAEYFSPEFAAHTYHNWSGFLFFPIGLFFIILLSMILNHGFRVFKRAKKTVTYFDGGEEPKAST